MCLWKVFSIHRGKKNSHWDWSHASCPTLRHETSWQPPPCMLRFQVRLTHFDCCIEHIPGKFIHSADTLSRAPVSSVKNDVLVSENELEWLVQWLQQAFQHALSDWRLTVKHRQMIHLAQLSSFTVHLLSSMASNQSSGLQTELKPYWNNSSELTVHHGMLLFCTHIVVPKGLQKEILLKLCSNTREWKDAISEPSPLSGGLDFQMTTDRWFRGILSVWEEYFTQRIHDPFKTTRLPLAERSNRPVWTVTYLLLVDYFSRLPEVAKLTTTTSASVIAAQKNIFLWHGTPEVLISENSLQLIASQMKAFASSYNLNTSWATLITCRVMAKRSAQ